MADQHPREQQKEQDTGKAEPARTDDTVEDLELVREEGDDVRGGQKRWADEAKP